MVPSLVMPHLTLSFHWCRRGLLPYQPHRHGGTSCHRFPMRAHGVGGKGWGGGRVGGRTQWRCGVLWGGYGQGSKRGDQEPEPVLPIGNVDPPAHTHTSYLQLPPFLPARRFTQSDSRALVTCCAFLDPSLPLVLSVPCSPISGHTVADSYRRSPASPHGYRTPNAVCAPCAAVAWCLGI